MHGRILLGYVLLLLAVGLHWPADIVAQAPDRRIYAVTATTVAQVRLLADGGAAIVYDRVHPDTRNVLPRRAFTGWIANQPFANPTGDPVVSDVMFTTWTSPATGVSYTDVALVDFVLPVVRDGAAEEVGTRWVFMFDGERWRWLPDIAAIEIDGLRDAIEDFPGGYQTPFRQSPYIAIDRFWQGELYAANLTYLPPAIVPVTTDEVETGCGIVEQVRRLAIFYCVYDATIYFDPAFRDEVRDVTGPFGWTTVLAHEWGHHVQALVGIDGEAINPVDIEVQADCLAAIVAQDTLARGEIGAAEVTDAAAVIHLAGDVPGIDVANPAAHGSAAERLEWFHAGFDRGFAGCDFSMQPVA